MITKFLSPIVLAAAALSAGSAQAASFNLLDDSAPGRCYESSNVGTYGNTRSCQEASSWGAYEMQVTAYANTGSGGTFAAAYLAEYEDWGWGEGSNNPEDTDVWGYGVNSRVEGINPNSPEHAMDNNGQLELMLFKFDQSIALNSLQAGWAGVDSDIAVFAYTGTGDAVAALTGATESTLMTTAGWTHIKNFADIGTNQKSFNTSGAVVSSSYWIVSAYSATFGGGWSTGNDYVKLKSVGGAYTCVNSNAPSCNSGGGGGGQVSEPGSLALAGLAAMGVFGIRRQRRRAL